MDLKCQIILKNNYNLRNYIRENSYLYKELNRNSNVLNSINEDMKKKYRLTPEDKLKDIGEKIDMVNEFMKIIS